MDSTKVIENLKTSTIVEIPPTSEGQTRPLARLDPEQQKEVWQKAVV